MNYATQLRKLVTYTLDSDNSILGYHGTSIEAIIHAAEHGTLPATVGSLENEFYMYAMDKFATPEKCQEETLLYATENAIKHAFIEKYKDSIPPGMDKAEFYFEMDDFSGCLEDLSDLELIKTFLKHNNIPAGELKKQRFLFSRRRSGIMLSIHKDVLKEFKGEHNKHDSEEFIVYTKALPIQYITGIKPLGKYEKEELEKF